VTLADLFAVYTAAFAQERRLLRLDVGGLAPQTLLAWQVRAFEAVSADYRLEVDCLSADGDLELKSLLGRIAEIGLLLPDGSARELSGLVESAAQTGSDGGFARYRLVIVPGLALLAHRRNSRVFQDLSVPQIVDTILAEHHAHGGPFAAACQWELQLTRDYPPRSYCLQYRESDHDFIRRLLAEEGIATRYAFSASETGTPSHTLILFDDPWAAPPCAQPRVRFHRADASEENDTLTVWHATRRLRAGSSALASFDYKPVTALTADETTAVEQGEAGEAVERLLRDYEPQSPYYAADSEELASYARRRQDVGDRAAKDHWGESTVRAFAAGTWFELVEHPRHDGRATDDACFLIRELTWEAQNNLPGELQDGLAGLLGLAARGTASPGRTGVEATPSHQGAALPYRNRLLAVRRDTPVLPDWQPMGTDTTRTDSDGQIVSAGSPNANAATAGASLLAALGGSRAGHARPTAPGMQTATVVGPPGEEIHTDALGRIKIRFHWARDSDHPNGGAALDDRASCWVRVLTPWAGQSYGHISLPRTGQEVLIGFLEGDIDRPVVLGSLYNGSHPTPAFSGEGSLPVNQALAGIKSQEVKGSGHNQLLFDDTTGQVRTQLASSHGASQLNLGHLIHPRQEGKGTPRGEGFELRTDHAGAIRAAKGLFLSADGRTGAVDHQEARGEALAQLDAALELARAQGETATHHNAEATETGDAKKPTAGQPAILMSAPAGIALTTPQAMTLASGQNIDQVSGRDTQQTTARRWVHNVGEKISLFVRGVKEKTAIKLFAAQGNIDVQAQGGDVEVIADDSLTITSTEDRIVVAAKEHITLLCGGAYIKIADGNIELAAPKGVSFGAAKYEIGGPASMNVPLPQFPSGVCRECLMKALASGSPFVAPNGI